MKNGQLEFNLISMHYQELSFYIHFNFAGVFYPKVLYNSNNNSEFISNLVDINFLSD